MKKYHQLLLLIISLVSLTLFLIYRHQYNRLHYVLEVFNFFGQPCNLTDLQDSPNILSHHDWGPTPFWQQSETNIYTYSAFWGPKQEAKAIVYTENTSQVKTCYLWFENHVKPVMGKFKFSKIQHDQENSLTAYFYYCSLPKNDEHIPYALSFSTKSKRPTELKKILLTNISHHKLAYNTTVCVSPSAFNKQELIEFLSFHQLIGVESFLFYTEGVPHRLTKIISNLSGRLGLDVAFIPFNFPKTSSNLIRGLVEADCTLRATHETSNVIVLDPKEYLVPSKYTLGEVLSHVDGAVSRVSVSVQTFCIKHVHQHTPVAIQNTDVYFEADHLSYDILRSSQEKDVINTQHLNKEELAVHRYVYCTGEPKLLYSDKTMLKYSVDFGRATLVQLLMHKQI